MAAAAAAAVAAAGFGDSPRCLDDAAGAIAVAAADGAPAALSPGAPCSLSEPHWQLASWQCMPGPA